MKVSPFLCLAERGDILSGIEEHFPPPPTVTSVPVLERQGPTQRRQLPAAAATVTKEPPNSVEESVGTGNSETRFLEKDDIDPASALTGEISPAAVMKPLDTPSASIVAAPDTQKAEGQRGEAGNDKNIKLGTRSRRTRDATGSTARGCCE